MITSYDNKNKTIIIKIQAIIQDYKYNNYFLQQLNNLIYRLKYKIYNKYNLLSKLMKNKLQPISY